MKVIHTGDIHLDSKLSANLPKDKAKERRDEILKAFVSLVSYAKEENVSAILIAGDLFDTRNTSALARNTFKNLLINNPDISFYYLRGNHDENTAIDVLDDKPDNLYLFSDSWTGYSLDKEDKVMFTGDTIFYGSVGRCDLPTGDENVLMKSLQKLKCLDPETEMYPGHGRSTTIAGELKRNMYLR